MKHNSWFNGLSMAVVCLATSQSAVAQRAQVPMDATTGHAAPYI